ncbi:MAG: prenyltransferase/squalene oxidase repeat-containing protein, partial [Aureliella sp.]
MTGFVAHADSPSASAPHLRVSAVKNPHWKRCLGGWTALIVALSLWASLPSVVRAQPAPEANPSRESAEAADAVDATVNRAIAYLMSKQRSDGAIVEHQNETTMTSLAIMAMASAGATTTENSPRGEAMRRALGFVLKGDRQDKDGYFGNRDGSRMYGHGITTLMLTEMLGMGADAEQDALIHERCQKAIDLILSAQKQSKRVQDRGGWRYTPNSNDSDLSVSVWQLMALRSAKNDGLDVPA